MRAATRVSAVAVALAAAVVGFVPPATAADGCTDTVSPGDGLEAALAALSPGDTLCVEAGTYDEEVIPRVLAGTSEQPITVRGLGAGDDRPLIHGKFSLIDADHWTVAGLRFTNPRPEDPDKRIVSILGGVGWTFEGNEVFDGPYSGLLVGASTQSGPPTDYTVRDNEVHDTGAVNLYLNPGRASTGGVVEDNTFTDSGTENAKLGWGGDAACSGENLDEFGIGEVVFRGNTMGGAERGALMIAEPGGLHPVDVSGNFFADQPRYLVRYYEKQGCLGDQVFVHDNAGTEAPEFSEDFGASPENVAHEEGNVFPAPQAATRTFGAEAPGGSVPGDDSTAPESSAPADAPTSEAPASSTPKSSAPAGSTSRD